MQEVFLSVSILIADEGKTIHKVIEISLEQLTPNITSCFNEADCLALLNQTQNSKTFDLLILDYGFSKTSPKTFLQQVHSLSNCPILLLHNAFERPSSDFLGNFPHIKEILGRPFEGPHLLEKVELCLKSKTNTDLSLNQNQEEDDMLPPVIAFDKTEEDTLFSSISTPEIPSFESTFQTKFEEDDLWKIEKKEHHDFEGQLLSETFASLPSSSKDDSSLEELSSHWKQIEHDVTKMAESKIEHLIKEIAPELIAKAAEKIISLEVQRISQKVLDKYRVANER